MLSRTQRIEAQPLDPDSWRLCDTSMPDTDADALIAYVERRHNQVEVVWLKATDLPIRFESLEDVLTAVREFASSLSLAR